MVTSRGGPATDVATALREVYAPLEALVLITVLTSAETIKVASNVFLAAKFTCANEINRLAASMACRLRSWRHLAEQREPS